MRWLVYGTTAYTVLVLPLEQFVLNAFQKAPSKDNKSEADSQKRTEKSGGEETNVKSR